MRISPSDIEQPRRQSDYSDKLRLDKYLYFINCIFGLVYFITIMIYFCYYIDIKVINFKYYNAYSDQSLISPMCVLKHGDVTKILKTSCPFSNAISGTMNFYVNVFSNENDNHNGDIYISNQTVSKSSSSTTYVYYNSNSKSNSKCERITKYCNYDVDKYCSAGTNVFFTMTENSKLLYNKCVGDILMWQQNPRDYKYFAIYVAMFCVNVASFVFQCLLSTFFIIIIVSTDTVSKYKFLIIRISGILLTLLIHGSFYTFISLFDKY